MAPESLSFRITRNTEDLAQTIHALSQRLVTLELRLAALELQRNGEQTTDQPAMDPEESTCLDNVERLLSDCRELLAIETHVPVVAAEPGPSIADEVASAVAAMAMPATRDLEDGIAPYQAA